MTLILVLHEYLRDKLLLDKQNIKHNNNNHMVISLKATLVEVQNIMSCHCFHLTGAKGSITHHRALTTELAHFQSTRWAGREFSPKSPSIQVCLDRAATLISVDVSTLLRWCDRKKYLGKTACPGTSVRGQSGRMQTWQNSNRRNFILGASYPVMGKGKQTILKGPVASQQRKSLPGLGLKGQERYDVPRAMSWGIYWTRTVAQR